MRVHELMTPDPITIAPEQGVLEALDLLEHGGFRHLPVMKGEQLIGMISDRDLRRADPATLAEPGQLERGAGRPDRCVQEVMSHPVLTLSPHDTLTQATQTLLEHGVGALPVLEGERLIGILSTDDVLRWVVTQGRVRAL